MVSYLASPEAALSRARASKLMAVLPLERDVIKFVILNSTRKHYVTKLSEKLRSLAAPAASGLPLPSDLSLKVPMSITGRRQTELDAAVNEIGNVMGIQGDVKSGRPRSSLRHDRARARSLGCHLR